MKTLCGIGVLSVACVLGGCAGAPTGPSQRVVEVNQSRLDRFIEQYAATNRFRMGQPSHVVLTPDGKEALFLRSGPRSFVQDLYSFEVASGQERVLLTADALLGGDEEQLSADEKARRERMRLTSRGITGFEVSKDGTRLLVPLSGRLFVYERAGGTVKELKSDAGYPLDPRFTPDGAGVACVRGGEVHLIDLASGVEKTLTSGAGGSVTNGLAEFAAQEEMGRFSGYWFSPDAKTMIYERADTAGEPTFYISDPTDPAKQPEAWPYPRAGTTNADVRLGIVPTAGGEPVWVDWNRDEYPYVANVAWQKGGPPTVLVQNRRQTEQVLYEIDPASGACKELLRERDPAWVNLEPGGSRWLEDGSGFLWMTEQPVEGGDGWRLELHGRDGKFVRSLTPGGFALGELTHVDEKNGCAYVSASKEPTESQVWRVALSGADEPQELTHGRGRFGAVFAKESTARVLTCSPAEGTAWWAVMNDRGEEAGRLKSRAEEPVFEANVEFASVGGKKFRAAIVRPHDFREGMKYPVILSAYTGPHAQTVTAVGRAYLLQQWMADQGFIVVSIDGRGTPGRGRAWERAWKESEWGGRGQGNLIRLAVEDQAEGLGGLGQMYPEIDLSRVGVTGWSFGGYFSALAVMLRPDVFKAGAAGAPVTEWRGYDTHYTERYLGLPQENQAGYDDSSALYHAWKLNRPLLLIHGTADDNVYFMHSLKLSQALFRAGKEFEFLPLAGFTHMVPEPLVTRRLQGRIVEFFKRTLGEPARTR